MPATDFQKWSLSRLTVDDLLMDPIVDLVMRRDGIDGETVRQVMIEAARKRNQVAVCEGGAT